MTGIRPIHLAYRAAQTLRMLWWRIACPHVHGAKVVVLGPERTVLLIRHSYASSELWMLPGGGVRRSEDAAAAVLRVGPPTCTVMGDGVAKLGSGH